MIDEKTLISLALASGAAKAAIIHADNIVLSRHFRDICQTNTCGLYNRCYTCPPYVGDIDLLMALVKSYHKGLLYQSIGTLEDSFDVEGMQSAAQAHAKYTQKVRDTVRDKLPSDSLYLAAGGCHLCDSCAQQMHEPCRFPNDALPSMESHGLDVYQLTQGTPLKYINGPNTVTYFSLVLWRV